MMLLAIFSENHFGQIQIQNILAKHGKKYRNIYYGMRKICQMG